MRSCGSVIYKCRVDVPRLNCVGIILILSMHFDFKAAIWLMSQDFTVLISQQVTVLKMIWLTSKIKRKAAWVEKEIYLADSWAIHRHLVLTFVARGSVNYVRCHSTIINRVKFRPSFDPFSALFPRNTSFLPNIRTVMSPAPLHQHRSAEDDCRPHAHPRYGRFERTTLSSSVAELDASIITTIASTFHLYYCCYLPAIDAANVPWERRSQQVWAEHFSWARADTLDRISCQLFLRVWTQQHRFFWF